MRAVHLLELVDC